MFRQLKFRSDTLFSSSKINLKLDYIDLATLNLAKENERPINPRHYQLFCQAAAWAENFVGYMRKDEKEWQLNDSNLDEQRLERRKKLIQTKKDFYLVMSNTQLLGTFSLTADTKKNTINLSYVYVHDNYRQLGVGDQILIKAKQIAADKNLTLTAHLLSPRIHGFYKKRGAIFVTEDRSLQEPCQLIRFS